MKKFIFIFALISLSSLLFAADATTANPLAGKTITGKIKDRTRTFTFSKDGKSATLDSEHNHVFVKEIDGVWIYEGKFKNAKHYDGFKVIDAKTVLVAAPSSLGPISTNALKDFASPEQVAANIEKLGAKYSIK